MKLSACIVVYNGYDEALKAAQTVLRFTRRHPLTLYLVDNASPDGSGQKLEAALHSGLLAAGEGQQVVVRCRTENGGFGTGHNMVLPELDSDYHFILNPDIQLTADTLSDLADWMEQHPDVVMARPALVFPDGRPQQLPLRRCALRPMVYRQLPALRFWAKYNDAYLMKDKDLTRPTEIEFCTGSFSAVRTRTFRAVGGFDEKYFMYVEDADLTQKILFYNGGAKLTVRRPHPEDAHAGQGISCAAVHGHPRLAPRRPPQPQACSLADRQPAAVLLQVGIPVVNP